MAKKLIPLLNRVLVQKIVAAPLKSDDGVLLPETAASKVNFGKVVAVGSGGTAKDGSRAIPKIQEDSPYSGRVS
ncbi:hypothetical protein L7F22_024028 [Adiantum nelumboides]|nr:hypothetical protein [Adiantum nelumboides]